MTDPNNTPPPEQPAAPPAYAASGQQPPAYDGMAAAPSKGLSLTSMILGIAGVLFSLLWFLGLPLGIAAVVTGFMAKTKQPHARPLWLTGLITGFVAIGFSLLWLVIGALLVASGFGANYG